jgi:hypothetical protein
MIETVAGRSSALSVPSGSGIVVIAGALDARAAAGYPSSIAR